MKNTYLYKGEVVTAASKKFILEKPNKVVARNRDHLEKLIKDAIKKYGNKCDLNFIDVSNVDSMWSLFESSKFNGDISKWNVSNVKDMSYMFEDSKFNGDISKWDVSKVLDMSHMFAHSEFNGDISKWDVSSVKYIHNMFYKSEFSGDISKWIPMMKKNGIDFKNLGLQIKEDTWDDIEV